MMRLLVLLLAGLLLTPHAGAQPAIGQDEAAITEKMISLVGSGAHVCGLIKRDASPQEAWRCAKSQDSHSSAFWLAVEGQPTDSAVWHIIGRSASGDRYVIFYTSYEYGQPQFAPSFDVLPCHHPFELRKQRRFIFGCGKDAP
jgi:hypothetical protein